MGGGDAYDERYAHLIHDLERVSISDQDFERRLRLLNDNPQIEDHILFAPAPSNLAAQLPAIQREPVQAPSPIRPAPVQATKCCAICLRITDIEWVQLPNCSGTEHVYCISCAERCVVKDRHLRTIKCAVCGASRNLFKDGVTELLRNPQNENLGRLSFSNGSCPFHKDLLLYFCLDCLEPICMKCQTGYHSQHEFETLDTTFNNAKKEIGQLEKDLKNTRSDAGKNIEEALSAQTKVHQDAQRARDQLRADMQQMREELDRKEQLFNQTIDTIERNRLEKLEGYIVKLTCAVDSCDDAMSLIDQAKATLNQSNPMEFVQFVVDKKQKVMDVVEMEENLNFSKDHTLKRPFPNPPTEFAKRTLRNLKMNNF